MPLSLLLRFMRLAAEAAAERDLLFEVNHGRTPEKVGALWTKGLPRTGEDASIRPPRVVPAVGLVALPGATSLVSFLRRGPSCCGVSNACSFLS